MPPAREPTAVPAPSGAEPVPHSTLPSPTSELPVRTARPLRPVASVLVAAVLLVGCTDAPRATLDDPRVDTEPPVAVEPAPDDAVCDQEERATLVAAVDGQLDAIADADWERALAFASSGFRDGIDADRFRDIITAGFPVVADNRARDVGPCRQVGDEATLVVTVEDRDGTQQVLLYLLEREADGWGIGGAAPAASGAPVPDEPTVTA